MSFAQEEILELFEEMQDPHAAALEAVRGGLSVYCVARDPGPKPPHRKAYNRAFTTKVIHEQIKARILAGERPKTGGRGRPPTRWWRVADELGIDIGQLPPVLRVAQSSYQSEQYSSAGAGITSDPGGLGGSSPEPSQAMK